jgi:hypothetical protein
MLDRAVHVLYCLVMAAAAFGIAYLANVIVLARTAEVFSVTAGLWLAAGFAVLIFFSALFELADRYPGL